jgi:hypothetical protein
MERDNRKNEKLRIARPRVRRHRLLIRPILLAYVGRRVNCWLTYLPACLLGAILAMVCLQVPDTPFYELVHRILDQHDIPWIDHGLQGSGLVGKVHEVTFTLEDQRAVLGVRLWEAAGEQDQSDVFLWHPYMQDFTFGYRVKSATGGKHVSDLCDPRREDFIMLHALEFIGRLHTDPDDSNESSIDEDYDSATPSYVPNSYAVSNKENLDLLLRDFNGAMRALAVCNMTEAEHEIAVAIQNLYRITRRTRPDIARLTREIAGDRARLETARPSYAHARSELARKTVDLRSLELQVAEHMERMEELRLELRALGVDGGGESEKQEDNSTSQEPGPAPGNRCPICNRVILGDGGAPGVPCISCLQRQREEGGGAGGAAGGGPGAAGGGED